MRKFFAILVAAILLLPAASYAVDGKSPFYGRWAGLEHHASTYSTILHYINITQYKTSEYFVMSIREGGGATQGEVAKTEVYSSHWSIVDDHLSIPTSGISYVELYYDKDTDTLYSKDRPFVVYTRLQ